ncbi:DUF559 domain-containing protein [soil metagenome]
MRLRASDLQHPFRGVYVAEAIEMNFLTRCRALQSTMSPTARFSDETAARIQGIPLPPGRESHRLHVTVAAPQRAPTGTLVTGHSRRIEPGDSREWHGLRISSPEQTWCEIAATLDLGHLVAAGDFLIHHRHPLTSRSRLADAASRLRGGRGYRIVPEALSLLDDRAESPQESRLRVVLTKAGIVTQSNFPIRTRRGDRFRADLAIPACLVILEYQGDYHRDPQQFRADMTRVSKLEAEGWSVIQINANDLSNPKELVERIRQVLSARTNHR